jgi:twitching motility two-component system response regulator PilG
MCLLPYPSLAVLPMSLNANPNLLGTDVETAPAGALRRVLPLNISGRLIAHDPDDQSIGWRVYLSRGDVHFAHSTVGHRERLSYALNRSRLGLSLADLANFPSDYEFLCYCWQSGQLSLAQLRQLLLYLTQEALVQVLALPATQVQFENLVKLDPLLVSMPFERAILPIRTLMTQWKELWPHLGTPFNRPYIHDSHQLSMVMVETYSLELFHRLKYILSQNLCLYQIAPHLDMSLTDVAKLLRPLIEQGLLGSQPYKHAPQVKSTIPMVACIDANQGSQRQLQDLLNRSDYEVLSFLRPSSALEKLAHRQTDLILMNAQLPNSYELCQALRQMPSLRQTPIVIFAEPTHQLDRSRARRAGATDCLQTSLQSKEFMQMVKQLTQR